MPIIVDEVVISVEVGNEAAASGGAAQGALSTEERQTLLSECVERVLDILQRKEER